MSKEAKPTHYLVAILILLVISLFSFTSVYSAPTETNQTSFWKTIYCNTIGDWFNSPRCPLRKDIDMVEYNTVTLVDDEPTTQINNTDTNKTESNPPSINKITINRDSPTTISPTNTKTPIFDLSILNNYVTKDYLSSHTSNTNSSDFVTRDFLSRQVGAIGDSFGRSLSDLSTRLTALIPSTASITNWDSFFTTPSTRILAGTNLSWDGNTLNAVGSAGGVSLSLSNNIFGQSSLAPTTTQNLAISGTGTSTFSGGLESWRQISSPYFQATSTTATSTFAGNVIFSNSNTFATNVDISSLNIGLWGDSLTLGMGPVFVDVVSGQKVSIDQEGIGGEISTQIKNRFLAGSAKVSSTKVIWSGNNNYYDGATVKNDTATMVTAMNGNTNYIIISLINASTTDRVAGGSGYIQIIDINNDLATTYPNNYLDVRTWLMSTCNPIGPTNTTGWYASTTNDVFNCSKDVPPDSLRADTIHLNTTGYTIVSTYIYNTILSRIYNMQINKPISYKDIGQVFLNPPKMGTVDLYSNASIMQQNKNLISAQMDLFNYWIGNKAGGISASSTGYQASSASGTKNIGIGENALSSITTGFGNIGIGWNSLSRVTSGSQNVAIANSTQITTGNDNIAILGGSLLSTGNYNIAIGNSALVAATSSSYSVAVGGYSLSANTTGVNNVAVGFQSLKVNTTGGNNTGFGNSAIVSNVGGANNSGFGYYSLGATTGSNNTGVGSSALYLNTTGADNTAIGYLATTLVNNLSFSSAIGSRSSVGCSYCMSLGGVNTYAVKVGIGTTTPFSRLSIAGIAGDTIPMFAISTSTAGYATSTAFIIDSNGKVGIATTSPAGTLGINGTMFIGGSGTSTIQGNLNVLGTLHAQTSYAGDLVFANDFRFTESQPIISSTTQGLILKNQNGGQLLSVDDIGNLSLTGDLCANGKECFGKSINTLTNTLNNLSSSTILDRLSIQSTNRSLGDLQLEVLNIKSALTTLNTTLITLSSSSTLISSIASSTLEYMASSTTFTTLASSTVNTITTTPSFIQSVAQSVLNLIQSTGNWVVGQITGTLAKFTRVESESIKSDNIESDSVQTDSVSTKSLCVDDICLSKDQLKALLINAGGTSTSSVPVQPSNVIAPENNLPPTVIEQPSSISTLEIISPISSTTPNDSNQVTPVIELEVSKPSSPESIINTDLNQNTEQVSTSLESIETSAAQIIETTSKPEGN